MYQQLEQVKEELKNNLVEFLIKSGVKQDKNKKFFQCINPDHNDRSPSMHIFSPPDGTKIAKCFGCGAAYDIFAANAVINAKPLMGYEFLTENVASLAQMFEIPLELRPMSEEEVEQMNLKSAFRIVTNTIVSNLQTTDYESIDSQVYEYLVEKQLDDPKKCAYYSIGTINNYNDLILDLKSKNISDSILQKAGITPQIFSPQNLIFVFSDEFGNPVGFAARNCHYKKEDGSSKYYNSSNSEIFNKSKLLYNLNRALRRRTFQGRTSVYIVEGYTDAIALDYLGLKTVSICGSFLTNDHIHLLQRVGITDIILLLDGDDAGKAAADKIVATMEGIRNFRVRIALLPEGYDPDQLAKEKGIDGLFQLTHFSPFEWRLAQFKDTTDLNGHEIASKMIPLIVNERSAIERDKMSKIVSERCDIPLSTVRQEVFSITNEKDIRMKEEREAIIDNHIKLLKKTPEDTEAIIRGTLTSLKNVGTRNLEAYGNEECVHEILSLQVRQEDEGELQSFYFWRMKKLGLTLDGNVFGKLAILNGEPNAGKTSFLVNFIIDLLKAGESDSKNNTVGNNEHINNISIIFHTVDDSRHEIIPRFISALAYEYFKGVTINNVSDPNKYTGKYQNSFKEARNLAYSQLINWAKEGRLIIKDSSHGKNIHAAHSLIESAKLKYPQNKIVYIVDNMYDLTDFETVNDENLRTKKLSSGLKDTAANEQVLIVATAEYRKGDDKNTSNTRLNEKMRGSKGMEYDANWIGHLINELHSSEKSEFYYTENPVLPGTRVSRDEKLPVITLKITKNKITGYKNEIHYLFNSDKAVYEEVNDRNVIKLSSSAKSKIIGDFNISPEDSAGHIETAFNGAII